MTRLLAPALLALAAAGPTAAGSLEQLVAGTGVDPAVAATLTPSERAALRFNRGADPDDRQRILPHRGPAAVDPVRHARLVAAARLAAGAARRLSLAELAALKHNAGTRPDDRQPVAAPAGRATMMASGPGLGTLARLARDRSRD